MKSDYRAIMGQIDNQYKRLSEYAEEVDRLRCRLWMLEEYRDAVGFFLELHDERTGQPHPHMKNDTMANVMLKLPVLMIDGKPIALTLLDCKRIMHEYFLQTFGDGCDYSLSHFTSGNIRLNRCSAAGILL